MEESERNKAWGLTGDYGTLDATQWLRSTAQSYAAFIPGAKRYFDSAFDDLDAVRNKHGKEVDNIIKEAYGELKNISYEGTSVAAATKAWDILQKHLKRIGDRVF